MEVFQELQQQPPHVDTTLGTRACCTLTKDISGVGCGLLHAHFAKYSEGRGLQLFQLWGSCLSCGWSLCIYLPGLLLKITGLGGEVILAMISEGPKQRGKRTHRLD